jgi:hypothetical protein
MTSGTTFLKHVIDGVEFTGPAAYRGILPVLERCMWHTLLPRCGSPVLQQRLQLS